jgi:L-ascorbate metabolism protein UlaG (beta-lactamase superfamily)
MKGKRLLFGILGVAFLVGLLLPAAGSGAAEVRTGKITFKWYGQACFLIETPGGVRILTDPVYMGDYRPPRDVVPDVVTVSHEHVDHNQVDKVAGKPLVLRGLTEGGRDFAKIDQAVRGVHIYTVPTFHDEQQGAERGKNAVFVFEFDGLRVVHLGDLGHVLTEAQVKQIGPADVLMIPVGGKFTIFGAEADKVVSQLHPRLLVIPMHFKTAAAGFLPYSAEDFAAGKAGVTRTAGNAFTLDLGRPPAALQYVLMNYR